MIEVYEDQEVLLAGTLASAGIDLKSGFNFRGFSDVPAGIYAYDLLETIGGPNIISGITRLETDTGRFESAAYRDAVPVGINFPVRAGEGYLLHLYQGRNDVKLQ